MCDFFSALSILMGFEYAKSAACGCRVCSGAKKVAQKLLTSFLTLKKIFIFKYKNSSRHLGNQTLTIFCPSHCGHLNHCHGPWQPARQSSCKPRNAGHKIPLFEGDAHSPTRKKPKRTPLRKRRRIQSVVIIPDPPYSIRRPFTLASQLFPGKRNGQRLTVMASLAIGDRVRADEGAAGGDNASETGRRYVLWEP